jgi:hypothetical protein
MPPLTTHLVIGERVFRKFTQFDSLQPAYGAFLLGCLLVDVNGFSDIDRSITHFDNDHFGPHPCGANNFMDQLEGLLIYPWTDLCNEGKAFVLGYFCHLAADEEWKLGNHKLRDAIGVQRLSQLIPVDVILTEFDVQSNGMFLDSSTLHKALENARIPNVLTHVPHVTFQRMWEIIQTHVLIQSSPDTFVEMIIRNGATPEEADKARQEHKQYHEKADAMIDDFFGGVRPRTETMINYTIAKMPAFWERFPLGD